MRNLKKVIALVAVFAMLVSTVAFAQTYSDVAENDTYAEAIETLSMLGILTGDDADGDGVMDFRPADTITRAEVAALVCRIQGLNVASQTSTPFVDVPSTHWASGYIAQAAGQKIINGYGDGNFGPDDNVQYEQVLKMLMETLGYNLFAADNGGYPTGYLTAAQRYGVLDGVVGGAVGAEANRGMVAQMIYNAIDTPLMDKYYYGNDATYMIYDGVNAAYMTLMSRDLKIVKASGIVTENSYSAGINTDDEKTMKLTANGNDVNYLYLGLDKNDILSLKQGDVDADPFLGYAVNLYAKKNVNGTYTLLAIAKDSAKNAEVAFDIDMFQEINGNKLTFEKENGSDATVTVAANPTIILNDKVTGSALADFFDAGSNSIVRDNDYCGQVTLIDTDDATGYEVVNVEIVTTAVINKVAPNGQISFLNTVKIPYLSSDVLSGLATVPYLKVDPDATDVIINLTKNGEAFDYTTLEKWDVLSVKAVKVGSNVYGLYNIEVLDDANYIDGYVSATKDADNDGYADEVKLNDGNWYDVSANGYLVSDLESGDAGRFYVDAYGNVVALDDDVEVEGVEALAADNYAYILNAKSDNDIWGNPSVVVQVLDKTGAIYEASLATSTTFVNLDEVNGTLATTLNGIAGDADNDFTLKLEDANATQMGNLADAMINNLVSYTANSAGQIKAITFAQNDDPEKDMYLKKSNSGEKYDVEKMEIDGVEVDDNTLVFYIANQLTGGSISYGSSAVTATVDYSSVAAADSLAEANYTYVAFDTEDDYAKVLVILNSTGEISPSANVAVINSIGDTVVGGEKVKIVEYYLNGELLTATTDPELATLNSAEKGDVYQVKVVNGVITRASALMTYDRAIGAVATNAESLIDPDASGNNGTGTIFGAVTSISKRGNLNLSSSKTIDAKDAEVANVYVLDPNLKEDNQLYVGSITEAYVDENITKAASGDSIVVNYKDSVSADKTLVVGTNSLNELYDYAFAYKYDGDSIDIVIYKAYEFDYTIQ